MLILVGRAFREAAEAALREHGLSLRTLSALGHLDNSPGLSYSDLARRAGVTPQSMQATLATLQTQGLVDREEPNSRGRAAQLTVTATGRAAVARGRQAVDETHAALLADLSPQTQSELTALLTGLLPTLPPPATPPS